MMLQTMVADIIVQAGVISGYDALALLEGEADQINLFYQYFQGIMTFFVNGPEFPIV